jgi:hypothetical protein
VRVVTSISCHRLARVALVACGLFLVLFLRRGDQLLHPQVWNEDGVLIVSQLVNAGPVSLLWPVNGYLVTVPKLIAFVSLAISPLSYPLIGTLLTWAFTVFVGVAIAEAPLVIEGGALLAFTAFLVPSDPEVFGIPLYAFWWAGLLIVAAALWRPAVGGTRLRIAYVAAGALSSPVVLLALPVFAYRVLTRRNDRAERIVAGVAAACAAIQVAVLIHEHNVGSHTAPSAANAVAVFEKFLGSYVASNLARMRPGHHDAVLLIAALATVAVVALAVRRARGAGGARSIEPVALLLYLWAGAIALALPRVDVSIIDPATAGPRYFFYAFVFEGWFFVHVAVTTSFGRLRAAAGAVLALAAINLIPNVSRTHDDLAWARNLATCAAMPADMTYVMPVESDGHAGSAWSMPLSGAQCADLLRRDAGSHVLHAPVPAPRPFAVTKANLDPALGGDITADSAVASNGWSGSDFQHTRAPGFVVVGSYRTSDANTGALTLTLHRGARLFFRSGPVAARQRLVIDDGRAPAFDTSLPVAQDWVILDFAARSLPDTFRATFRDDGTGWGEWSAVALRAPSR